MQSSGMSDLVSRTVVSPERLHGRIRWTARVTNDEGTQDIVGPIEEDPNGGRGAFETQEAAIDWIHQVQAGLAPMYMFVGVYL